MPPEEEALRPSAAEVSRLRKWIDQGASWPDKLAGTTELTTDHWSFQPVVRPTVPESNDGGRTPVDAFLLKTLNENELSFSEPAASPPYLEAIR